MAPIAMLFICVSRLHHREEIILKTRKPKVSKKDKP